MSEKLILGSVAALDNAPPDKKQVLRVNSVALAIDSLQSELTSTRAALAKAEQERDQVRRFGELNHARAEKFEKESAGRLKAIVDLRAEVDRQHKEIGEMHTENAKAWHEHSTAEARASTLEKQIATLTDQLLGAAGVALIAAERKRQIEKEGWTKNHDAGHAGEELATAAVCYALPLSLRDIPRRREEGCAPRIWPWDEQWWKPTPHDRVRELVKAGALIAAEIDRLAARAPIPEDSSDKLLSGREK